MHVSWRDKCTNKSIKERTGQGHMKNIICKRTLNWQGQVFAWTRLKEATMYCIGFLREESEEEDLVRTERRLKCDLRGLEIAWKRAEELARDEWRCVVTCADMHRMN